MFHCTNSPIRPQGKGGFEVTFDIWQILGRQTRCKNPHEKTIFPYSSQDFQNTVRAKTLNRDISKELQGHSLRKPFKIQPCNFTGTFFWQVCIVLVQFLCSSLWTIKCLCVGQIRFFGKMLLIIFEQKRLITRVRNLNIFHAVFQIFFILTKSLKLTKRQF